MPERINEFHTVRRNIPDGLSDKPGVLYLDVGADGVVHYVRFLCPCGDPDCLHILPVHAGPTKWDFEEHEDGAITLAPSILRKVHRNHDGHESGCGSHFFIRRNRVEWCE